jgi:PAS domain S-box-containing protein
MKTGKQEFLEKKVQKLKAENQSLKEKIALLRRDLNNLQKSQKKIRKLFHSIPAGIVVAQQGKVIEINETALDQLGCSAEDVIGRDFLDFVHPDFKAFERDLYKKRISRKSVPDRYETNLIAKNGDTLCCEVRVNKIRFNGRTAFLSKLTRLEKRKKREKELIRSKKIESLMTMASGLNREFTGCLHTICKTTKHLKALAESGHNRLLEGLEKIESATYKPLWITQKLESLTRAENDPSEAVLLDLKKTVRKAVEQVIPEVKDRQERLGVKMNLKTYLRSTSSVEGSPTEIQEVISSMIINALEAMPRGGDVYLTTEENGGFAHIYIQDSGSGIHEQVKDRIFDPFFTTGDSDKTGLGLSIAYAIVKRHKGDIEITSQKDQGTTALIKLPLASKARRPKTGSNKSKIKNAQFLIIEDEDMVKELLSQILVSKGHRVEKALSGLEALGRLKRKKFDFVIAGFRTSDMNGGVLANKIKKLNRELPVALVAGHDEGESLENESAVDLIIRKPVDLNRVVNQLLEALGRKGRGGS